MLLIDECLSIIIQCGGNEPTYPIMENSVVKYNINLHINVINFFITKN